MWKPWGFQQGEGGGHQTSLTSLSGKRYGRRLLPELEFEPASSQSGLMCLHHWAAPPCGMMTKVSFAKSSDFWRKEWSNTQRNTFEITYCQSNDYWESSEHSWLGQCELPACTRLLRACLQCPKTDYKEKNHDHFNRVIAERNATKIFTDDWCN